jgi:hypothetical protein
MTTLGVMERVETIASRSVAQAPAVEFVTKRRWGLTREQCAHAMTGRDTRTGKLTLAVSVRNRTGGMVRFDGDLWRLPFDLCPDAILLLETYWELLNQATPRNVYARMNGHFSRNTIIFDATADQADDWRDLLTAVLSDTTSYVGIPSGGF